MRDCNSKTVLDDIRLNKVRIAQREEQRAELEKLKKYVRPKTYKRVSRNITAAISAASCRIKEVEAIINAHPHELQRAILYEKYVHGHSLLEIAEKLNYCENHIYHEHIKAVNAINEKHKEV